MSRKRSTGEPLTTRADDAPASERDPRAAFRECMSTFTTGVTVVLADEAGAPAGATVNSFTSVSLDPLLVLVSLRRSSRTLHTIRRTGRFTVSVLGRGQEHVASAFASSLSPFPEKLVHRAQDGQLYVTDALAYLSCSMHAVHAIGDHDVVVGETSDMEVGHGDPLVFHRGAFVALAPDPLPSPVAATA